MLKQIQLKQFILIEQLTINFKKGMTVITGETGAGKSIIIDALLLALGGRLANDIVRASSDRADMVVYFDIENHLQAQEWLKAQELFSDADCIIRRTVSREGRSRCYINDIQVTLQTLQQLGALLVNIHSQHEHQQLLKRDAQRDLLDDYAGLTELSLQVKKYFHERQVIKTKIEELNQLNQDKLKQKEFIQFQLQEFAKLNLSLNEVNYVIDEHKRLANADTLLASGQKTLDLLCENTEYSILALLSEAQRSINTINELTNNQLANCEKLIEASLINLEEIHIELRDYLHKLELNPDKFQEIEQRLAKIHELARKHRVTPQELIKIQDQLQQENTTLDHLDDELKELHSQLETIEKNFYHHAEQLSQLRKQAAIHLSQQVTEKMHFLGLENGLFNIAIETDTKHPRLFGFDQIEFLVTANKGQPLSPLHKVASGGELSRISLAIQVIISEKVTTPIMIFDEVDVGIGGKTADKVGRLLKELGKQAQVICITHLPQVAAQGQQHLQVSKSIVNMQTQAQIQELSEVEKIEELSRMLGGLHITEQTRAHAKEMLLLSDRSAG